MGEVVIHAGMPKAGSTTIQRWMARHLDDLRTRGVHVLVTKVDKSGPSPRISLDCATSRRVNSGTLYLLYRMLDRAPSVLDEFFAELSAFASRYTTVVVSSEVFAELLFQPDLEFLRRLDELARTHRVRLAYYVRPQHTAFEALWRHFGFRDNVEPLQYLEQCTSQLDFRCMVHDLKEHAPSVAFEIRPFRNDLLHRSNVAADFAAVFLGASDLPAAQSDDWQNRGLPLVLANALRFAPNGYFWDSPDYYLSPWNNAFTRLKDLFEGFDGTDDERTHRSRLILQAHCHERFEPGNAHLISTFGWPTKWFVPPVDDGLAEPWDIRELDELWRPKSSPVELSLLYHALKAAITDDSVPAPKR
jgi:hypothetical protein